MGIIDSKKIIIALAAIAALMVTDMFAANRAKVRKVILEPTEIGTWNQGESGHPGVFQDEDGQVYLFFQGKAHKNANYLLSVCKVKFQDF